MTIAVDLGRKATKPTNNQTAGHLIGPHIEKSVNQEQYACAIKMIGELETDKKKYLGHISRNRSYITLIYLFQFDKSAKTIEKLKFE